MRAGRYPDGHPLEIRAREQLQRLSDEALRTLEDQQLDGLRRERAAERGEPQPPRTTGTPLRRWG